jgi:hypothetical protein
VRGAALQTAQGNVSCLAVTGPGGVVARVFVSYANTDQERAARLHRWLVAEGHEVFLVQDMHEGLLVGDEWERRLWCSPSFGCVRLDTFHRES